MARARKNSTGRGKRERHISVRGVRRNPPDLRKLSRAFVELALTEAAAEAAAQAEQTAREEVTGEERSNG